MKYEVVVIAGPSGSGKDSVLQGVLSQCESCVKLVTACTRPMRPGEVDGINYFFMTNEEFFRKVEAREIPEYNEDQWRETGTTRGIYLPELHKQLALGKTLISQLQLQGLEYMRKHFKTVGIFIHPSSPEELKERIIARDGFSQQDLASRLTIAQDEIENQAQHYEYQIINKQGQLDKTIQQVLELIH